MLITYNNVTPAVHAFICGISDYTHLPDKEHGPDPARWNLLKVESAAMGAFRFFEWLQEAWLPLPLGTVELILAPSSIETRTEPDLQELARPAEADAASFVKAVSDWRARTAGSRDSIAIFYFAGHGVQRDRGSAIILLRDIMANMNARLENGVNFADVHDGFAPAADLSDIARRQLFFLDTCRAVPPDIGDFNTIRTRPLFDTHRAGLDDRVAAPVYFASLHDAQDYALPAQGSLFNRTLLRALTSGADISRGTGAKPVWPITIHSLAHALWVELGRLGARHVFSMGGHMTADADICTLTNAPTVRMQLDFDPRAVGQTLTSVILKRSDGHSRTLKPPLIPLPHNISWPAGQTTLELCNGSGTPPKIVGPIFVNQRNSTLTVPV